MIKRTAIIAAGCVLAVSVATAACGAKGTSGGRGAVTINLVGADYGNGSSNTTTAYWTKLARAFHRQNPKVTVRVETINWNDYDTKVKTQLQNKNYPDILQGEFFPQYATDGLLYPISDVVSNPATGASGFTASMTVNGTQYALPFDTSARALFYNKKAFAAAGIKAPPTTWAELKTDAGLLKAKGYVGYALPLGPEEAQAESYLWMLGNNGGWQTASGRYEINSPQNIQTFRFLKGLVEAGDTEPNPATYNRTADAATAFAAGKVGMEMNGPFLTATIAAAGNLKSSDYAAATIPGKNGPLTKTLGVADALQVFKGDRAKLPWIKKFLDFALDDTNQLAFAKEYALLPGMQSALDQLRTDPVLGAFVLAMPNTVLFPSNSNWTATVLPAIKQSIGTAVTGNPVTVLGELQRVAAARD
jgi:multiple sugar transport system substrate-binding protein